MSQHLNQAVQKSSTHSHTLIICQADKNQNKKKQSQSKKPDKNSKYDHHSKTRNHALQYQHLDQISFEI